MAGKSTKKPRKSQPEPEPDDAVIDSMPPDAVLAALCNHKFEISEIKAFGKSKCIRGEISQTEKTLSLTAGMIFSVTADAVMAADMIGGREMVITDNHTTLEEAIAVFTEQSKPTLKEYNRHRFFTHAPDRNHHKKQKSRSYAKNVGAHNRSHSQRAK